MKQMSIVLICFLLVVCAACSEDDPNVGSSAESVSDGGSLSANDGSLSANGSSLSANDGSLSANGSLSASGSSGSSSSGAAFPPSATQLTANVWASGSIASGDVQWYRFTATAATQYIHVKPATDFYVYTHVYTATNTAVGSENTLNGYGSAYASKTLVVGDEYYLRVRYYNGSGAYQVGFTASILQPGETSFPPASPTPLAAGWVNGSIAAGGVQWFGFTATAASLQYIHFKPGTLTGVYAQTYAANGTAVGNRTALSASTYSISLSTLTNAQVYYIRVSATSAAGNGAYQIAFNASALSPGEEIPSNPPALSTSTWANGSIDTSGVQWFRFTASATSHYIHFLPGTITSVNIRVLTGSGASVSLAALGAGGASTFRVQVAQLTVAQEYYIRVWPSSAVTGTYQIAFTPAQWQPGESFPPASAVPMTADTWANGSITAGGYQWFRFTATATSHYIHFERGGTQAPAVYDVMVQVYTAEGADVGTAQNLYGSNLSVSRSFTAGQTYYIRLWPYYSSETGAFRMAFNTANTPPT